MAKQSGIHQLRGKVGDHSYYRQTGIQSGLVRAINPAMSNRVKTDEAYANTRLNNSEFGQAGRLAAMIAQYITPKFRPMVLPFSQSKMAKVLLEFIKNDANAPWGQRNLTSDNSGDAQVAALNAVVKNRFEDWGVEITGDEETTTVSFESTQQTIEKALAVGATGLSIRFLASTSWIGIYNAQQNLYAQSYARANIYENDIDVESTEKVDITYALRPAPPTGWPAFMAERMGVAILLPYREVNGERHVLQEHCTFYAFLMADGRII